MKLTVIGGGGVRAPLFVTSALRRAAQIGLDELCLMDLDGGKLELIGGVCRAVARRAASNVRITTTTDARAALTGASHVVTTIRVGNEQGRVLDERIALRHGVLGQETTGPGGFAMALRSIPAILAYAELLEEVSPGAWLFNFTNPAGLVTQALRDRGFERTVGICDSANAAQLAVSRRLHIDLHRLEAEVFGLNHLSWCRSVRLDGVDQLVPLLHDPTFLAGSMLNMFDADLVQHMSLWLNEYLFYFYYAEQAVERIMSSDRTRGEEIVDLNRRLLELLRSTDVIGHPDEALRAYYAYQARRNATYMHYAQPEAPTPSEADDQAAVESAGIEEGEGYAGVALDLIEALTQGRPLHIALNVPNGASITGMHATDVVEVSCVVDRAGIRPVQIGEIAAAPHALMQSVKLYERLTVEAIQQRSRVIAVDALMAHPLVLSYSRATSLVNDYLEAHAQYVGVWQ
ncbi:MAG: glycosyl hydrolase [Herpetosiphon sp.]